MFNMAMEAFQNKQMERANELFERAIKMNPSLAEDFEPFRKHLDAMPDLSDLHTGEVSAERMQEEMSRFEKILDENPAFRNQK